MQGGHTKVVTPMVGQFGSKIVEFGRGHVSLESPWFVGIGSLGWIIQGWDIWCIFYIIFGGPGPIPLNAGRDSV